MRRLREFVVPFWVYFPDVARDRIEVEFWIHRPFMAMVIVVAVALGASGYLGLGSSDLSFLADVRMI